MTRDDALTGAPIKFWLRWAVGPVACSAKYSRAVDAAQDLQMSWGRSGGSPGVALGPSAQWGRVENSVTLLKVR